jgi:hypothetical protein
MNQQNEPREGLWTKLTGALTILIALFCLFDPKSWSLQVRFVIVDAFVIMFLMLLRKKKVTSKTQMSVVKISGAYSHSVQNRESISEFNIAPSIVIGDQNLNCQLFPAEVREALLGNDDVVAFSLHDEKAQIQAIYKDSLPKPLSEAEYEACLKAHLDYLKSSSSASSCTGEIAQVERILKQLTATGCDSIAGNLPYPRLYSLPYIKKAHGELVFNITLAPSHYGLGLADQFHIEVPRLVELRKKMPLASAAIRVALTYQLNVGGTSKTFCVLQKRTVENMTYKGAWDVSAAGYINPNPDNVWNPKTKLLDLFAVALDELKDEIMLKVVPTTSLPTRESCYAFGMSHDQRAGHLDVIMEYHLGSPPPLNGRTYKTNEKLLTDWNRIIKKNVDESKLQNRKYYVDCVDLVELSPNLVAKFLVENPRWVSAGVLTLVILLRRYGNSMEVIHKAFREAGVTSLQINP